MNPPTDSSPPPPTLPLRTFEHRRIWRLSPELMQVAAALIAEAEHPFEPELIVGVLRGGGPLAAALAEQIGVPHVLVTAKHNPDDRIGVQGTGTVSLDLRGLPDTSGVRVLLVDDICGTGATITALVDALGLRICPAAVRVAVLCRNIGSPVRPHSWVWDVSDWTVFPWEPAPDRPTELLPIPTAVRHP